MRDVPDNVRDELAARAARNGQSLQGYLRAMLIAAAAKPTADEVIERARARVASTGPQVGSRAILDDRDAGHRDPA